MGKFDINPFDRSALRDYKLLAGRKNEFNLIRFKLRNSSKNNGRFNIIIAGNRGVGKTSFLNLIEGECPTNNIISVRINLTEANSANANEFFWHVFIQTLNTLFEYNLFGGTGGEIDKAVQSILHSNGIEDQANWVFRSPILRRNYLLSSSCPYESEQFISDIKQFHKGIINSDNDNFNKNTKIVYLIDESHHIYSKIQVIEQIRYIVQHPDLKIGFVFAGDNSFENSKWESEFGGSWRDFEIINLNYFDNVESVIDYFRKSLDYIGWTENEIEDTLFFRFKRACTQIFQLTSGKPSWINAIAKKMFERCMNGESNILRFDRLAQNDVKNLLESTNLLDSSKIDFIDNLSRNYYKWLTMIFDCEYTTLNQVYFFGKFIFIDDNFLDKESYAEFCQTLLERGIIYQETSEDKLSVGYMANPPLTNILDKQYIAFGYNTDTIKQWLQITTDGKVKFRSLIPDVYFMFYINDRLITENINCSLYRYVTPSASYSRIIDTINKINNDSFDVNEINYEDTKALYDLFKMIINSKEKEILYGEMEFLSSGKKINWNVYNYDEKNKLIPFHDSPKTICKFIDNVASYNSESNSYEFKLSIDKLPVPDISKFQKLIISSNDKKKYGVIFEDKLNDLVDHYVKESNLDSSHSLAMFFYERYYDGFDLNIRMLNNSSYIFIVKNEFDKAIDLLKEAYRKFQMDDLDKYDLMGMGLIFYNLGIANFKLNNIIKSKDYFESLIEYSADKDKELFDAQILYVLQKDASNNIISIEIKENEKEYPVINIIEFAKSNLAILE